MSFIQFAVVLLCILTGAQVGGIGLGVLSGIDLAVLSSSFHLQPASPPIDVILIIMAVVSATVAMQASDGPDYMTRIATRMLHRNPRCITFIVPAVTYTFIVLAGTGHVAYSVLPVITKASRRNGIRPSHSLTIAIIASQLTIVVNPIAIVVVACVSMLEPQHITMADMLKVTVPSTILGIGLARAFVNKLGKGLKDSPHCQVLLRSPNCVREHINVEEQKASVAISPKVKLPIGIFLTAALLMVVMGALPELRPVFEYDDTIKPMGMAHTIEVVMLSASALITLVCKPSGGAITRSSVFRAGMCVVITVFGVTWLGDTLMNGHLAEVESTVSHLAKSAPRTSAFVLFILSVLVNSQGAAVTTPFPIAIRLGIPVSIIIGTFAAVNDYFFIPNYDPTVAPIDFDVIGSTRIGKYIFNHGFMIPGLLNMAFSPAFDLLLVQLYH